MITIACLLLIISTIMLTFGFAQYYRLPVRNFVLDILDDFYNNPNSFAIDQNDGKLQRITNTIKLYQINFATGEFDKGRFFNFYTNLNQKEINRLRDYVNDYVKEKKYEAIRNLREKEKELIYLSLEEILK